MPLFPKFTKIDEEFLNSSIKLSLRERKLILATLSAVITKEPDRKKQMLMFEKKNKLIRRLLQLTFNMDSQTLSREIVTHLIYVLELVPTEKELDSIFQGFEIDAETDDSTEAYPIMDVVLMIFSIMVSGACKAPDYNTILCQVREMKLFEPGTDFNFSQYRNELSGKLPFYNMEVAVQHQRELVIKYGEQKALEMYAASLCPEMHWKSMCDAEEKIENKSSEKS